MTRAVLVTSICLLALGIGGIVCTWFSLPMVDIVMSYVCVVAGALGVAGTAFGTSRHTPARAAVSVPVSGIPITAPVPSNRVQTFEPPQEPQRPPFPRWASRSSDRSQAGFVLDHVVNGRTFAVSGSALGDSHDQSGEACDDAYALLPLRSGGFVVAVADGLGSTQNAHVASDQAVKSFVIQVQDALDSAAELDSDRWAEIAAAACTVAAAAASGDHLGQLQGSGALKPIYRHARKSKAQTTLVGAVLRPNDTGASLAWVRVGDSDVGIVMANGKVRWFHDHSRQSNVVDNVLPDSPESADTGVWQLAPDELCILATDGFIEIADETPAGLRGVRLDATTERPPHRAIIDLLLTWVPGVVDDRTFVLVGTKIG